MGIKNLGTVINTIRNSKGLTIEELCAQADIVPSQLYYLESGKRNVGLETIDKVIQALGADLSDLLFKAFIPTN